MKISQQPLTTPPKPSKRRWGAEGFADARARTVVEAQTAVECTLIISPHGNVKHGVAVSLQVHQKANPHAKFVQLRELGDKVAARLPIQVFFPGSTRRAADFDFTVSITNVKGCSPEVVTMLSLWPTQVGDRRLPRNFLAEKMVDDKLYSKKRIILGPAVLCQWSGDERHGTVMRHWYQSLRAENLRTIFSLFPQARVA